MVRQLGKRSAASRLETAALRTPVKLGTYVRVTTVFPHWQYRISAILGKCCKQSLSRARSTTPSRSGAATLTGGRVWQR
uniref:S1 motif domain-containing protein n=1 Tax=Ascaris lumbricoides TaxID=6252 RepID=A0A0M3I6Y7_ASCLU